MDQKLKDLWNNNKIVFFILLPLIAIWMFRNILIDLLIGSSHQLTQDATGKDQVLANEEAAAKAKAEQLQQQAAAAGQNKPEVGADWYKK
jgi:hypothetical protein